MKFIPTTIIRHLSSALSTFSIIRISYKIRHLANLQPSNTKKFKAQAVKSHDFEITKNSFRFLFYSRKTEHKKKLKNEIVEHLLDFCPICLC